MRCWPGMLLLTPITQTIPAIRGRTSTSICEIILRARLLLWQEPRGVLRLERVIWRRINNSFRIALWRTMWQSMPIKVWALEVTAERFKLWDHRQVAKSELRWISCSSSSTIIIAVWHKTSRLRALLRQFLVEHSPLNMDTTSQWPS